MSRTVAPSLSLSLFLSLSLSVFPSLSGCLSVLLLPSVSMTLLRLFSLSVFVPTYLSICVVLTVDMYRLDMQHFVSRFCCVFSLSLSLCLCLFLCLSACLPLSFSYVCVCLPFYLSVLLSITGRAGSRQVQHGHTTPGVRTAWSVRLRRVLPHQRDGRGSHAADPQQHCLLQPASSRAVQPPHCLHCCGVSAALQP